MKVLVCGGRQFDDVATLASRLSEIHRDHTITEIIEGGATGADTLARKFGEQSGIPVRTFPADWERHGRAAGPIRTDRCSRKGSRSRHRFPRRERHSPHGQTSPRGGGEGRGSKGRFSINPPTISQRLLVRVVVSIDRRYTRNNLNDDADTPQSKNGLLGNADAWKFCCQRGQDDKCCAHHSRPRDPAVGPKRRLGMSPIPPL